MAQATRALGLHNTSQNCDPRPAPLLDPLGNCRFSSQPLYRWTLDRSVWNFSVARSLAGTISDGRWRQTGSYEILLPSNRTDSALERLLAGLFIALSTS